MKIILFIFTSSIIALASGDHLKCGRVAPKCVYNQDCDIICSMVTYAPDYICGKDSKPEILEHPNGETMICCMDISGNEPECIPSTDPPTDPPTEPPTDPPTEPPTDPPTEPPTDPPTEPPTDPPTEPPTDPPTEPPTDPPTEPPTDPPTEPPTDPPTEPPTDPPTEPPTDPPTEPPTDPPTEPPTDPPTEPPTDPPTNPPCTNYAGSDEFEKAVDDLKKLRDDLQSAGSSTSEIDSEIDLIQDVIDELVNYLNNNCDNLDVTFVSERISYIKTKLIDLQFDVEAFTDDLEANFSCGGKDCGTNPNIYLRVTDCACVCRLDCNLSQGEIFYWGKCTCTDFEEGTVAYGWRTTLNNLIDKISVITSESEVVKSKLITLYELYDDAEAVRQDMQRNFEDLDKDELKQRIEEITKRIDEITTEVNTYITSEQVCAGSDCPENYTPVKETCECYTSGKVEKHFEILTRFNILDKEIFSYNGKDADGEIDGLKERAMAIRDLFETLFNYFYNNSEAPDDAAIDALIQEITEKVEQLENDFADFYDKNNPSSECKLEGPCESNEVLNKARSICACIPVENYEMLPDIENDLERLRTDINALEVSQDKKDTLLENLDRLEQGIPDLHNYVDEFSKNLDMNFVQERTDQLVGWYAKLNSDVAAAQGDNTMEICDASCPNARWYYDSEACSCTCDVQFCFEDEEVVDPWGCQCVEKTDCLKTSDSCDEGDILDYAMCECKPAP